MKIIFGLSLCAIFLATLWVNRPTRELLCQMFVSQRESVVRVEADNARMVEKGSGVLIRSNQVLTAHHVIRNVRDSSTIKVIFKDGTEREATIAKASKLWDVALLEFEPVEVEPASLAARPAVNREKLTICGFPGGGEYTERQGRLCGFRSPTQATGPGWFVVDIDCKSGMSGGPVFNQRGEVVGTLFGTLKDANCTGLQAIKELLNEQPIYKLSASLPGDSPGDSTPDTQLPGQGSNHTTHRQRGH